MVEQRPFKSLVAGSNPARPTTFMHIKLIYEAFVMIFKYRRNPKMSHDKTASIIDSYTVTYNNDEFQICCADCSEVIIHE